MIFLKFYYVIINLQDQKLAKSRNFMQFTEMQNDQNYPIFDFFS